MSEEEIDFVPLVAITQLQEREREEKINMFQFSTPAADKLMY